MKKLAIAILLMGAGAAWGQNDLPLVFKGTCIGNQTDIHDLSPVPNTPAVKCDSLLVMQTDGHTVVSFSNSDPANPVLMFSGDLLTVATDKNFDPYMGPVTSAFPIDRVLWGDGTPGMSVQAARNPDRLAGNGCYFHYNGQGWGQLSMVECELVVDTPEHRPRRVTVTFKRERKFTVDGQQISVEYDYRGANSFLVVFNQMKIDGSCGLGIYQVGGVLKHVEPGTPIQRLFQTVCYKDVVNSHSHFRLAGAKT